MKIRTKVWFGMALVGLMVTAGSLMSAYYIRTDAGIHQLQAQNNSSLMKVRAMQATLARMVTPLRDFLIYGDSIAEADFLNLYSELTAMMGEFKASGRAEGYPEGIRLLEEALDTLKILSEQIFRISDPLGDPESVGLLKLFNHESDEAERLMGEMERNLLGGVGRTGVMQHASSVREKLAVSSISISILLILTLFFWYFYFSRIVSKPMLHLIRGARKIAEGDFTQRFQEQRRDEFGDLNRTFNFMLDTLQEREDALAEKNQSLNRAIGELGSTNEELQITNEELESTNEELQISNEELESTNEELNVSNQELETNTRELDEARRLLEEKNRELKEAHGYLETIYQQTHTGICVIDRDQKIESANQALLDIMGYTESEMIGAHCYEVFYGASEPCPECATEQSLANGIRPLYHHPHIRRDGDTVILDIATTPLIYNGGQVTSVIKTVNDVTKITTLNKELQEQKNHMSSILLNMGEGVAVISSDYKIEYINEQMRREFGSIVGRKCYQAFHGLKEACTDESCSLQQIVEKGKARCETTKQHENGRYYRMVAVPLQNPDGSLSTIQILQNITEQKKMEEERKQYTEHVEDLNRRMEKDVEKRTLALKDANTDLRLANVRLLELNQEKSEFIDIAVHDLRTPLTSIISYSELLRKYDDESPETRKEFLSIILSESYRMKDLISDYLDLSKLESGFVDFKEEQIDMHSLIKEILASFESRAASKAIRLSYRFPKSMPGFTADTSRIKQAFANLIDNAVKFTPEGGEITLFGEVLEQQGMLRFAVQDSGPGMAKEDQEKLFKKFERIMDSKVRKDQGSGLGLSIVKTIVEHYCGTIWVESQKGKGSRFIFTLPLGRQPHTIQHVLSIQKKTSTLIQQIGPLWKGYLERNYVCAYFGNPTDIDRMKTSLTTHDLDVYDLMEKEQVIFSPAKEPLLNNGRCDGEHLFDCVGKFCDRILRQPWEGLVVVRDMSRLMQDETAKQEMLYFEKKLNTDLQECRKPVVQICQYLPDHFSEVEISNLKKNHPYYLKAGEIVAGADE